MSERERGANRVGNGTGIRGTRRELELPAFAKINLLLDVTGRRPDGYHEVDMVMQAIRWCDHLRFALRDGPGDVLTISGRTRGVAPDGANLVLRAVGALRQRCGSRFPAEVGLEIHLDKRIPTEAGLGGGSADAAAALLAVNELLQLGLGREDLLEIALSLGADVPFCLLGGTARARGIGEDLVPLPELPRCSILVAKPRGGASTKAIYEAIDRAAYVHPDAEAMARSLAGEAGEPFLMVARQIGEGACNVMQPVTAELVPSVESLVDRLLQSGACAAQMTGSGTAVFGLFGDRESALLAKERIEAAADRLELEDIALAEPLTAAEARELRGGIGC